MSWGVGKEKQSGIKGVMNLGWIAFRNLMGL